MHSVTGLWPATEAVGAVEVPHGSDDPPPPAVQEPVTSAPTASVANTAVRRRMTNLLLSMLDGPGDPGACEHLLPAGLERRCDGSVQDGVVAERRDQNAGSERREGVELTFDGPEEQIRAPAHTPSEDHGFGIEDRRDSGDAEGESTGFGIHHPEGCRVPPSRGREDPLGRHGRTHPQLLG